MNRRSFLKLSTGLPLAFSAAGIPRLAQAADERKAKSVILLWLWGAPSHLDLVDPKPQAPTEYRGPFCPIQTKTPGLQFTELLPRLSQRTDQFTLIRSMVSSNGGHPGAGTVGLTGFEESPGPVQPNFGSIISKSQTQPGDLPPFFYVGRGIPRDLPRRIKGYGGGTLGPAHDPFLVNCTPLGEVEMPGLRLLDGLTPDRINNRQDLLQRIDGTRRLADGSDVANWSRVYKTAYNLLTKPEAVKSFDLTEESESTREQYGYTKFGQSCLLARRLVQAEVPYIQVNWSEYVEAMSPGCDFGWDTHIYNFELLQDRHGPVFDRAFSALLDDLKQRGLLETTLVLAMGEFGRTPKINKRAARDHWPRCYFSMWAGAGIEPGRVIGESDRRGEDPVTEPITPLMVGTTVAELCGVTAQARAEMQVLDGGKVIDGLV
ncbi:MAG: DUF1501 domain-containing protein [Planctomycetota bacterium]|nr:DUF1501 domain-containing protein [Planctomycetota bacterium]